MKRLSVLLVLILALVGCGSSEQDEVDEEQYQEYVIFFMNTMDESNRLLSHYNGFLDNLYTRTSTEKQFAESVKGLVPQSSDLINKLDSHLYSLNEELAGFHREFIDLLQRQHHLFLKSVDDALSESGINKDDYHEENLAIKQEQTVLIEMLKVVTLGGQ